MKSLIGKLGMLALLATVGGAVGVGCSSNNVPGAGHQAGSEGPQGEVTLKLVPVSGVTLNSVHYTVTNSAGGPVSEGDLPTPGDAKDFSFGLSLPVGTGYNLSLSAASAELNDDVTCSGASAPFNVTSNTATAFSLTLTCFDNTKGSLIGNVDVKTDACPRIVFDYVVATPATATIVAPKNKIAVAAKAHDLDSKTLTYSWKIANPAVGTFAPTTGATSDLTCLTQGLGQVVTVTASNGECTKTLTTTVSCKSLECGNGVVDPTETCDTALAPPCPSDCTYSCGDGVAEAPAEDCDPGSTTNPVCNETCHFRPTNVCGDGFINGTEKCDITAAGVAIFPAGTPAGSTCNACTSVTSPQITCGDGVVAGTEVCDVKTTDATYGQICNTSCTAKVSTAACVACENAGDCFESVSNCLGVAAPFTAAQQATCYSVMTCIEQSNCLDGTGSLGACYCGSLDTGPCGAAPFTGAGSPNGPCVDIIKAGFPEFTTNQDILGGLFATDFPSGAAMKRLNCQKTADSSACISTCGLNTGGPVFP